MSNYTLYTKLILIPVICTIMFSQTLNAQNTMLYGMTSLGGANSQGAIIGFNVSTGTESLLWSFGSGNDGQDPTGNLVYCPLNGLLYGLTVGGGAYQFGAIVSFNPATDSEALVWSLGHGSSVASPYGEMVYDANNEMFYGMAFGGGNDNTGGIFRFNPAVDSAKTLWSFGYGPGASLPYGDLVLDPDNGLYYGMSTEGGNTDGGAIVTFNATTDTAHHVFSFNDGQGGETPNASLVWFPQNHLFYGVTTAGGADSNGVLFSYNPVDSVETVLYTFGAGNDASQPQCNLIYDESRQVFYGLSIQGGTNSQGTIFSFNPTTNSETVLYSFGNVAGDGQFPNGSLIYDASNQLYYGLAQNGGAHTYGTIFSFNPSNNAETTLWSFGAGTDGSEPQGSLLLLNNGQLAGIKQVSNNYSIRLYPNPGNGSFVLQSQNTTGAEYNIYDINGNAVSTGTIESDIQNITVANAQAGMYLLKIIGKEQSASVRFIVAK